MCYSFSLASLQFTNVSLLRRWVANRFTAHNSCPNIKMASPPPPTGPATMWPSIEDLAAYDLQEGDNSSCL